MAHDNKPGEVETHFEPLMVAGRSDPAGLLRVTAPFDQQLIAEVETCDGSHIDDALRTAHALFRNRDAWIALHDRIGILERTAAQMVEDHEQLTLLATREGGKPLCDSRFKTMYATPRFWHKVCFSGISPSSFTMKMWGAVCFNSSVKSNIPEPFEINACST